MPERATHSRLVIKVTAGKDDPERCNQAFTVAATAARPGRPNQADSPVSHSETGTPLADLLAGVLAAGSVTVCTQCAARRNIGAGDLLDGIRIAGAATFVAEVMTEGAQALVY